MFELFFKIVVVLIIALVLLLLIWLIAFLVHIVHDEMAMDNKQKYSPKLIDTIVNGISGFGLRIIVKIYQFFHQS